MIDDDTLFQQINQIAYPKQIDITNRVMQQIDAEPQKMPLVRRLRPVIVAAAASVALALAIGAYFTLRNDYSEPELCNMIASVYDMSDYSGSAGLYDDLLPFNYVEE